MVAVRWVIGKVLSTSSVARTTLSRTSLPVFGLASVNPKWSRYNNSEILILLAAEYFRPILWRARKWDSCPWSGLRFHLVVFAHSESPPSREDLGDGHVEDAHFALLQLRWRRDPFQPTGIEQVRRDGNTCVHILHDSSHLKTHRSENDYDLFGKFLSTKLQELFSDRDDTGTFIVLALNVRSQVLSIEDCRTVWENQLSNLLHLETNRLLLLGNVIPSIPDEVSRQAESYGFCVVVALSRPRLRAAWPVEASLFAVSLYGGLFNLGSIWLDSWF